MNEQIALCPMAYKSVQIFHSKLCADLLDAMLQSNIYLKWSRSRVSSCPLYEIWLLLFKWGGEEGQRGVKWLHLSSLNQQASGDLILGELRTVTFSPPSQALVAVLLLESVAGSLWPPAGRVTHSSLLSIGGPIGWHFPFKFLSHWPYSLQATFPRGWSGKCVQKRL